MMRGAASLAGADHRPRVRLNYVIVIVVSQGVHDPSRKLDSDILSYLDVVSGYLFLPRLGICTVNLSNRNFDTNEVGIIAPAMYTQKNAYHLQVNVILVL